MLNRARERRDKEKMRETPQNQRHKDENRRDAEKTMDMLRIVIYTEKMRSIPRKE